MSSSRTPRWLAGRQEEVPPNTHPRFCARLQSSYLITMMRQVVMSARLSAAPARTVLRPGIQLQRSRFAGQIAVAHKVGCRLMG